jgi:hypothetical protein
MLFEPLPAGEHSLHIEGVLGFDPSTEADDFHLVVDYVLTVE